MSLFIQTAIVLLLAFIESTLLFLPITPLFLILTNYYKASKVNLFLAFLAGVSIDILQVHPIGKTSMVLLMILLVSSLYANKMRGRTAVFLAITAFLSIFFYALVIYQAQWVAAFTQAILLTFLTIIIFWIIRSRFNHEINPRS